MIVDILLPINSADPRQDVDATAQRLQSELGLRFVRGAMIAQLVRLEFADLVRYRVTADALRVRDAPVSGMIVGLIRRGEEVDALEEADGWVRHRGGWSSGEFLQLVE